ncbi:MAG TPA: hypothetical protein PKN33_01525 [Phycisphaerae bacterium]|nr:hypothetical protein [Phycisphaerae bacterium]
MNISVTQPRLSLAKRASNLSILGNMVRKEAQRTPAPDLIVLPDCCVATQETAPQSNVTTAMCQGFAEAFAWWAREWGVWIAVGHSTQTDDGLKEVATLFDPDGDPFIRASNPRTTNNPRTTGNPADDPWVIRNSPIGRIALCSWNAPTMDACPPIESKRSPDLIIIPAINPNRSAIEIISKAHNAYAVFAGCVLDGPGDKAQGFVADRSGQIIAETTIGKASSAFASVEVDPCNTPDEWEANEVIE